MAFRRTSIIVPAVALIAGLFGAYKLWSAFHKRSTDKTQSNDEHFQDAEAEVIVQEVKDANTCSAGLPLHMPSLYKPPNSSPRSRACSASLLAQANFCDKGERSHETSKRSSSPPSSLIDPAGIPELIDKQPTSDLLTTTEIQENSKGAISKISRLTITDLSSSGTHLSQELANELKIEIEYMKGQLPIYSETLIGLQMGRNLGCGAYGRVHEADTRYDKIAVKVLTEVESATLPASPSDMTLHDLYAEALLLSNLHHPNIVSFEFVISEVSLYKLPGMATELMSDNLGNIIRTTGGPRSWNEVWNIANQVANGLKYLHSHKIIHFDIKSSNILLNHNGSRNLNSSICKVADFGLAKKNSSGSISIYSQRGTSRYMAPEVIRTSSHGMQSVTEKVDVYSFGVLLWELIAWDRPYRGMTDDEVEALVLTGERPTVPIWCDILWKELMEACWRENEDLRPNFNAIVDYFSGLPGAP